MTVSLYSGASGLIDSSAPQSAREVMGGLGTVDGGAGGSDADGEVLADGEELSLAVGEGLSVAVSEGVTDGVSDAGAVSDSVAEGVGSAVVAVGSAEGESDDDGSSVGASVSAAKAAGAACSDEPLPGSTVSSRSPAGSFAETLAPAVTRTSTPLDGPTHRGSVDPRTPERPASVRPSMSVSSGIQEVQVPFATDLVRTSTAPVTFAAGSVQVTPSMLNGAVSRRPSDAEVPSAATFSSVFRTSVLTGPALLSLSFAESSVTF
ncbi:hypothetical protein GCM10018966_028550 [Streptomyces yanii]